MTFSTYLKVILIAVVISGSFITLNSVDAQTSPDLELVQASCFTDIYETDDLYCGVIYNLPTYTSTVLPISTPEAWCDELLNKNGCTDNPVNPSEPTSLISNSVLIELKDGSNLIGLNETPRIGYSLSGVYLPAGHGVTYADVNITICVTANPILYPTFNDSVCDNPDWNGLAQDLTTQRTALGDWFKNAIKAKTEFEARSHDYYLADNLINVVGAFIVEEALPGAVEILPDTFSASFNIIIIPTPTPVPDNETLSGQVRSLNPTQAFYAQFGPTYLNTTADGVRLIVTMSIAALGFMLGFILTKDILMSMISTNVLLITAMPFDLVHIEGVFAFFGILCLAAAAYIVKRIVVTS